MITSLFPSLCPEFVGVKLETLSAKVHGMGVDPIAQLEVLLLQSSSCTGKKAGVPYLYFIGAVGVASSVVLNKWPPAKVLSTTWITRFAQ